MDKTSDSDFQSSSRPIDICRLLSDTAPNQLLAVTPRGYSMFPFFSGFRDTLYLKKAEFPLKKGDIVLYRRENGICVVHRIHHSTLQKGVRSYFMLGDSQTELEGPLPEDRIFGVVSHYIRKGKTIDCTSFRYGLLWRIWLFLRPLRPFLLNVWQILHKAKII